MLTECAQNPEFDLDVVGCECRIIRIEGNARTLPFVHLRQNFVVLHEPMMRQHHRLNSCLRLSVLLATIYWTLPDLQDGCRILPMANEDRDKPGPKEDRLKLKGPWEKAVKKALKKQKPENGSDGASSDSARPE